MRRKRTAAKTAPAAEPSTDSLDSDVQVSALGHKPTDIESKDAAEESPILVKEDSISVFNRMFPVDVATNPGSVRWSLLVHALTDAGFSATEAGGSAVSFSNEAGKIVFHKPHPDPSVDTVMLQSIGKRLRKWFGWDRERFQVRSKDVMA